MDDAIEMAEAVGWSRIDVYAFGDPIDERPAMYVYGVLGLYQQDGIVKEAWTGG